MSAALPKNPPDFVWCCFSLLASRRAIEALRRSGLRVPFGPGVVQIGKRQPCEDFVALQLDLVRLYSDTTLEEFTMSFCKKCGNALLKDVRAEPKGPRQFVRKRIPRRQGLVRAYESVVTLATEQFIEAVRVHKLTGLAFREFGVYV